MASSNGLMQEWGVETPKTGAADQQSEAFSKAFNPGIEAIGVDINKLTDIAMAADLEKLSGQHENLAKAYQQVRRGIDPNNPEKAKKDIKKVLKALVSLKKQSAQQRKDTEKLHSDWLSLQATHEATARNQVDALEVWGEPLTTEMLATLADIDDKAQTRDWTSAGALLLSLVDELKPIHEDYLKQKAAKAIYDIDWPVLEPRIDAFHDFETPTEASDTSLAEIVDALPKVERFVEARDYLSANTDLKVIAKNADLFESLMAEITAEKTAFEKRRAIVETDLSVVAEGTWHGLAAEVKELRAATKEVDDLAKFFAFTEANEKIGGLETKAADFMVKAQNQISKEDLLRARLQALLPRFAALDDAPANNEGSRFQDIIAHQRTEIDKRIPKGEFAEGLDDLVKVEADLAAFESYMVEFERDKADYVARNGRATQRLGKLIEPVGQEMTELDSAIKAQRAAMEKFAAELMFDFALDNMETLESQLAEYEGQMAELAEDKAAYEAKRQELDARIEICSEVVFGNRDFAYAGEVADKVQVAEDMAADQSYQTAYRLLLELTELLVAAEQVRRMWAEKEAACKTRFAELKKPIDDAMAPIEGQEGADLQAVVTTQLADAQNSYDTGDYQGALDGLILVEGATAEVALFRAQQAGERKTYEERHKSVKAALDAVHGETGDETIDAMMIGAIEDLIDAETLAAEARFDEALSPLHDAATAAAGLAAARADFEAEKKRYEERKAALEPRIAEALTPVYRDWAEAMKKEVVDLASENQQHEENARFDPALANLDTIESNLASLEAARAQNEAEPITKDKLEQVVAERLAKLEPEIEGIVALPDSVVDAKKKKRLTEWRNSASADSTLGALEDAYAAVQQVEALLAGCAVAKTKFEEAKAEYDKRAKPLEPKIEAISKITEDRDHHLFFQAEPTYLAGLEMQNFAKADDYAAALAAMDRVETMMRVYEDAKLANEQQEAAYKQRVEPLTKPLDEALSVEASPPWAEKLKADLSLQRETMESKAAEREFDQALLAVGKLEPLLARYKTLADQHEALRETYESRLPGVLDRLVQALAVPPLVGWKADPELLPVERDEMEAAARKGDYQEALSLQESLEENLELYQVAIDRISEMEEDNKARLALLDKRLARLGVWEGVLNEQRDAVAALIKEAREILTESPAGCAQLLDRAEPKMAGYEDAVRQVEEQKRKFEARFESIADRLDAACEVTPATDWEDQHGHMVDMREGVLKVAERGGYDHVVMDVDALEELLAECEVFIKRDRKKAA